MTQEQLMYVTAFLGILARLVLPWAIAKKKAAEDGKTLQWKWKYVFGAIPTIILSFIATPLAVAALPEGATTFATIFSAVFGWFGTDIFRLGQKVIAS